MHNGKMNDTQKGIFRNLISSIDVRQLNLLVLISVITFILWRLYSLLSSKSKKQRILNNDDKTFRTEGTQIGASESSKQFCDKKVGDELDVIVENDGFHDDEVKSTEILYRPIIYSEKEMIKRSQIFYESMKLRRSVRCFSSRPVPLKVMQNLIKTAGSAPSGANLQPWTFCLVENEAIKCNIREVVEYEEQLNYSRRMGAKWVLDVQHLNVNWNKPYLTEAPYLIVVMKHSYQILKDGSRQPTYYNEISTSIATGFLLAAIQNAGLVTVTTTPLNAGSSIRELLARPPNEKVMLLLPVGYPAENAHVPNINRKSIEEIIRIY